MFSILVQTAIIKTSNGVIKDTKHYGIFLNDTIVGVPLNCWFSVHELIYMFQDHKVPPMRR